MNMQSEEDALAAKWRARLSANKTATAVSTANGSAKTVKSVRGFQILSGIYNWTTKVPVVLTRFTLTVIAALLLLIAIYFGWTSPGWPTIMFWALSGSLTVASCGLFSVAMKTFGISTLGWIAVIGVVQTYASLVPNVPSADSLRADTAGITALDYSRAILREDAIRQLNSQNIFESMSAMGRLSVAGMEDPTGKDNRWSQISTNTTKFGHKVLQVRNLMGIFAGHGQFCEAGKEVHDLTQNKASPRDETQKEDTDRVLAMITELNEKLNGIQSGLDNLFLLALDHRADILGGLEQQRAEFEAADYRVVNAYWITRWYWGEEMALRCKAAQRSVQQYQKLDNDVSAIHKALDEVKMAVTPAINLFDRVRDYVQSCISANRNCRSALAAASNWATMCGYPASIGSADSAAAAVPRIGRK